MGTEKQVKWANDIRNELVEIINSQAKEIISLEGRNLKRANKQNSKVAAMLIAINEIEDSKFFIENRNIKIFNDLAEALGVLEVIKQGGSNEMNWKI